MGTWNSYNQKLNPYTNWVREDVNFTDLYKTLENCLKINSGFRLWQSNIGKWNVVNHYSEHEKPSSKFETYDIFYDKNLVCSIDNFRDELKQPKFFFKADKTKFADTFLKDTERVCLLFFLENTNHCFIDADRFKTNSFFLRLSKPEQQNWVSEFAFLEQKINILTVSDTESGKSEHYVFHHDTGLFTHYGTTGSNGVFTIYQMKEKLSAEQNISLGRNSPEQKISPQIWNALYEKLCMSLSETAIGEINLPEDYWVVEKRKPKQGEIDFESNGILYFIRVRKAETPLCIISAIPTRNGYDNYTVSAYASTAFDRILCNECTEIADAVIQNQFQKRTMKSLIPVTA